MVFLLIGLEISVSIIINLRKKYLRNYPVNFVRILSMFIITKTKTRTYLLIMLATEAANRRRQQKKIEGKFTS